MHPDRLKFAILNPLLFNSQQKYSVSQVHTRAFSTIDALGINTDRKFVTIRNTKEWASF